eukprot:5370004-Alexandrium_andersonii.AAC.1
MNIGVHFNPFEKGSKVTAKQMTKDLQLNFLGDVVSAKPQKFSMPCADICGLPLYISGANSITANSRCPIPAWMVRVVASEDDATMELRCIEGAVKLDIMPGVTISCDVY